MVKQKLVLQSIPVREYAKKQIDPRWLAVVDDVRPDIGQKLRDCRKQLWRGVCDNNHTVYRGWLCRQRDFCPVDAAGLLADQTDDAVEILKTISARVGTPFKLYCGELTLPKPAWNMVGDNDLKRLRKVGSDVMNEMFNHDGRYMLGYSDSSHFWHSDDPFFGWFPHVHLNLMNVALDRDISGEVAVDLLRRRKIQGSKFVQINCYLDKKKGELEKLGRTWEEFFENEFGSVRYYHGRRPKRWVIYWKYSVSATLDHRLKYCFRNPVEDCYKAILNGMVYRAGRDRAWLSRLLDRPKSEKRTQWFGYLSDGLKARQLAKLNIKLEHQAVRRRKRRHKVCLKCGTDILWERFPLELDYVKTLKDAEVMCYGKPEQGVFQWLRRKN